MSEDCTKLDLYVTHRSALVDYAAPIVGCRARAEDVVQEAYLRFSQPPGDGRLVDRPVGYLYRIVRNLALDWLRSLGADQRRHEAQGVLAAEGLAVASPEEEAMQRDALRHLQRALAAMPERQSRAFRMYRLEERTLQEIAEALGVSVATAHRLVRDATVALARVLRDAEKF